jgi:hypothetical protein
MRVLVRVVMVVGMLVLVLGPSFEMLRLLLLLLLVMVVPLLQVQHHVV